MSRAAFRIFASLASGTSAVQRSGSNGLRQLRASARDDRAELVPRLGTPDDLRTVEASRTPPVGHTSAFARISEVRFGREIAAPRAKRYSRIAPAARILHASPS